MTGRTVMEYVKLRRLAYAADCLAHSEYKILNIALKTGFKNHETFTRSFKEVYGVTPTVFREQKLPATLFKAPDLSTQYYLKDLNFPITINGIVFDIKHIKQQSPRHFTVPTPDYAVAVAELDSIYAPDNFSGWTMPVGDYIVCCIEGESAEQLTADVSPIIKDYVLNNWAEKNQVDLDLKAMSIVYNNLPDITYMEMHFKINTIKGEFNMYKPKSEVQFITLDHEIKVVGINLQKSGMPISMESIGKMWDKKEVYKEEIQNNTKNTKRPIIEYGICLNTVPDYVVGREVTEFGEQDERYFTFAIPPGKYIKTVFNAESFERMISKLSGEYHEISKNWAKENGFIIDETFNAEVYPHETTMIQYPEMYLLFPVKD